MSDVIRSFIAEEQGLTMVEYAIAGGLVVAVGTVVFTTLGTNIVAQITHLASLIGATA